MLGSDQSHDCFRAIKKGAGKTAPHARKPNAFSWLLVGAAAGLVVLELELL